jgi:hypothetical protein
MCLVNLVSYSKSARRFLRTKTSLFYVSRPKDKNAPLVCNTICMPYKIQSILLQDVYKVIVARSCSTARRRSPVYARRWTSGVSTHSFADIREVMRGRTRRLSRLCLATAVG